MDEYLKTLLEQIRCKKARPYIRQELQDHIEDQIAENMHAGMDRERAEKEAVRDMGDPVETGISLDRIHKPQIAWKLLVMVILLSVAGILTHIMIARHINEGDASVSGRYVIHVMVGIAVMIFLYFLDYTLLARFSKVIAVILLAMCLLTLYFGCKVNGMRYFIIIGGGSVSIPALMLFYVPIYGGVIYQYHGSGYTGLLKAIVWMVIPVVLVLRMPGNDDSRSDADIYACDVDNRDSEGLVCCTEEKSNGRTLGDFHGYASCSFPYDVFGKCFRTLSEGTYTGSFF